MTTRLTVPQLDANILDVTVTVWRKQPGDRVRQGEIVAEITTDKATFEYESPASGVLLEILAAVKSVVPSGYILALVGEPGESDPDAAEVNRALMEAYRRNAPAGGDQRSEVRGQKSEVRDRVTDNREPGTRDPVPGTAPAARPRATPRARRLAQENGLDLARIQAETGVEVIDEAALRPYLKR